MLKFIDFLQQKLNETKAKESLVVDYYFLPTNTSRKTYNNSAKKINYAKEVLDCAKLIVEKYKRMRLAFREENNDFFNRAYGGFKNKSQMRRYITEIFSVLKPNDFDKETMEDHSAYVFIIKINELEKRLNKKFKDRSLVREELYIKFEIVRRIDKDKKGLIYGIQVPLKIKNKSVIVDPERSFVDFISFHISVDKDNLETS